MAAKIPNQIAQPATGAPYCDCSTNVSHKNAPGAISAIAFIVSPVSPSVFFITGPDEESVDMKHLNQNARRKKGKDIEKTCPPKRTTLD
jgi:hypothetical protein